MVFSTSYYGSSRKQPYEQNDVVASPVDDRDFQTIVAYSMAILDKLRSLTLNPMIENERT
ncbi:hypothetical protein [Nostoc sp. TCL240-02]|uniref:hypothetical protein n=1 Tax=Nostoc sp. TCL240-02 TaxID=2572090 RepID=UPI00157F8612|nr:hypothetical protein [Nostoc sp. TCL240-02]QKQ72055.1 hypothetical protein FBB35_00605 [Nostoc sp. TCL240-02]